ncbi:GntR family transcriptional regulator [Treponema sp. OMZ 840]|uniref:GntR family transcriptional regulator n=1 Tax=Treponema sp. OMZ 840 TaxID=244313 RepID=UPI003D8CD4C2
MYYNIILQRIIHDEYKSGDIITEKSLVDEFNVSKSPVREALVALCNEKLLKSIPRFGYEVTPISDRTIKEVLDYRIILECGYLKKNWNTITEEQITQLQDLLYKDYSTPTQREALEHWEKNCDFHLTLFSFSNNKFAYEEFANVLRILGIAYVRSYWKKLHLTKVSSSANYHKQLINYLLNKNKEAAIECLKKDIVEFFTPGN